MKQPNLPTDAVQSVGDSANPGSHFDLLLDVEMEATIRFGECQLLLRDILSAGPGFLIELNRELNEPADLLVAGRLIARGEVVVVNGNFGLRITELASSSQGTNLVPA
jgi:flagellar motor switch protein FliN/FliY